MSAGQDNSDAQDKGSAPQASLAQLRARRHALSDEARSEAVRRTHAQGRWTAREAIAALCDAGSFIEFGGFVASPDAQMQAPADGLITGSARQGGHPLAVFAYDYSVHAGSQSAMNHRKLARVIAQAAKQRIPLVGWLEGAGARPHDMLVYARGPSTSLAAFARLSGWVPTVGIVPALAFAGHANLAGMCDLLIAVRGAAMGLAGPPLVETAIGEKLTPQQIGALAIHVAAGVVDLVADDPAQAVQLAHQYLSYFRGTQAAGDAPPAEALRDAVPENPRQAYDVREVARGLCDIGSTLELKADWGGSVVTMLGRIEGCPIGIVANQPMTLAGAIDADSAAKSVRFVQTCDAYDIPLLMLCDTPGLHVGPAAEATGLVRHSARLLVALANATTPVMTVVLRKGYGLGHYIMGSQALEPMVLVAWPTAEFGGMGLEGAVSIIHRRRLDAIADAQERAALHAQLTSELREANTAYDMARRFLIDDVIDPADTRMLLAQALATWKPPVRATRKRVIDSF